MSTLRKGIEMNEHLIYGSKRSVHSGHTDATPPGNWYDQGTGEFYRTCSCGARRYGPDPDLADWYLLYHITHPED